jgi:predicted kinase
MSKVIIMCGLPNSGKSTWSKKYAKEHGYKIFSGDDTLERIAAEDLDSNILTYNESFQHVIDNNIDWWGITLKEAKEALSNGDSVIIDGTHMSKKSRRRVCNILGVSSAHVVTVIRSFIDTVFTDRDGKTIPNHVISSMTNGFSLAINEVDKRITITSEVVFIK